MFNGDVSSMMKASCYIALLCLYSTIKNCFLYEQLTIEQHRINVLS